MNLARRPPCTIQIQTAGTIVTILIVGLVLAFTSGCADSKEKLIKQLAQRELELGRANDKIKRLEADLKQKSATERDMRLMVKAIQEEYDIFRSENAENVATTAQASNFLVEKSSIIEELERLREVEKQKKTLDIVAERHSILLKQVGPNEVVNWLASIQSMTEDEFKDFSSVSLKFVIPRAGSPKVELQVSSKFLNPFDPPVLQTGSATVEATVSELDFDNGVATVVFPNASKLATTMDVSKTNLCNVIISHGKEKILAVFQREPSESGLLTTEIPFTLIEFKFPNVHFIKEQYRWVAKR